MTFTKFLGILVSCFFLIPWICLWLWNSRKTNKNHAYSIVIFDISGQIVYFDPLRVNFRNNDVAWSFMKEYKSQYPSYNFGLVSIDDKSQEPTMIKYL